MQTINEQSLVQALLDIKAKLSADMSKPGQRPRRSVKISLGSRNDRTNPVNIPTLREIAECFG